MTNAALVARIPAHIRDMNHPHVDGRPRGHCRFAPANSATAASCAAVRASRVLRARGG